MGYVDYQVRDLVRGAEKLEGLKDYIAEKYIGQVTYPASLKNVCYNIDIVFSSAGTKEVI